MSCYIPPCLPAGHLTTKKSLGTAQVVEPAPGRVHGMKLGESVNDDLRKRAISRAVAAAAKSSRHVCPNHDPRSALHEKERAPDDFRVFAVGDSSRCLVEGLPESRKDPIFPPHVVRAGGDGAEWRPSQD